MENTTTTKKRKFESNPSNKSDSNFFEVKPTLKQVKLNFQPTNNPPKSTPWHSNQQLLTKFIPLTRQLSLGTGHIPTDSLLICSWNINGLKRIVPTGQIQAYFRQRKPDIFCLNETKIDENEASKLVQWIPPEYTYYFNSSKMRKGYSGVAIITKYKPISVQYGMGIDKHDKEGRLLTLEFETFYMVSCYVPLSGMGFKRLPYRINEWDPSLRAYLSKLKEKKPVVVCGDFNVTHRPIDGWKEGEDFIGSSTTERNSFSKLLDAGFIDTFRYKYPGVQKFSWWNLSKGNKEKDRGRRFDYFLTSQDAAEGIKDAFINKEVNGSDHCPVELLFNPNFKVQKDEEQNNQKQNLQKSDSVIVIDSQPSKPENVIVID